jgi:hypothetical protein
MQLKAVLPTIEFHTTSRDTQALSAKKGRMSIQSFSPLPRLRPRPLPEGEVTRLPLLLGWRFRLPRL